MPVALHYTSTKLRAGNRNVLGMQVAIADLMKAYLRFGTQETFSFLIGTEEEKIDIEEVAKEAGVDMSRLAILDRRYPEKNLAPFSTVFRAEPDTHKLFWQRELGGNFNFCSLAHAIGGVEAGEVLQDYCLSPSRETDAIICPSKALKSAIEAFWNSYTDYLNKRFGATYRCPVQLPVIPLGIDVQKFETKTTPQKRSEQRKLLGIGDDDIVILWVGRMSAAIKAHPLAMFQAVERAAQITGANVHFVMLGYFVPAEAENHFKKLAADTCSRAKVSFVAADDARFPDGLWGAADIFLSLIDNPQESFGLTPIEAMAAGLPRVVSDWDGYRDSVTDGEDGFLIRTAQPPPGNGFDLTAQVLAGREVYGGFLAKTALTIAVDAEQAAERLVRLIADKQARAEMAEKARKRVRAVYDWKHIILAYEGLWKDLEARRNASSGEHYASALPQLPDPYTMYGAYPTSALNEADVILIKAPVEQIKLLLQHTINTYAHDVLMSPLDISELLAWLVKDGAKPIAEIFAHFPSANKPSLWRTLAWLLKLGIVESACQQSRP